MASLSELQLYQGNAALGAGGGGNVLPQKSDFENINRAGELWALQQVNANKNVFDQKIKDRDYKRELFDKGQVKVGKHIDKDNPVIMDAQKKMNDAYEKWVNAPEGKGNAEAYQKYIQSHEDYANVTTEAQSRYDSVFAQEEAIGKEKNQVKRAEMQKHLDEQKSKAFGYEITPYQQAMSYKPNEAVEIVLGQTSDNTGGTDFFKPLESAAQQGQAAKGSTSQNPTATGTSNATTGKETKTVTRDNKGNVKVQEKTQSGGQPVVANEGQYHTDPQTGRVFRKEPEKVFDYNSLIDNSAKIYSDPRSDNHQKFDAEVEQFNNIQPYMQSGILSDIFGAVNKYNQQLKGTEGFKKLDYNIYDPKTKTPLTPEQIKAGVEQPKYLAVKDNEGKYHLNISAPEYVALQALAKQSQNGFKTGGYVFDEKATEMAEKRRDDIAKNRLGQENIDLGYAKLRQKTKMDEERIKSMNGEDVMPFFKNQWKNNFKGIEGAVGTMKVGGINQPKTNTLQIPANNSMPLTIMKGGKEELFKPIGGTPIYENGFIVNAKTGEVDQSKPNKNGKDKVVGYKGGHYDTVFFSPDGTEVPSKVLGTLYGDGIRSIKENFYKTLPTKKQFENSNYNYTVNGKAATYDDYKKAKEDEMIKSLPTYDEVAKGWVDRGVYGYGMVGQDATIREDDYLENQKLKHLKKGQGSLGGVESVHYEKNNDAQEPNYGDITNPDD